jgi:hypothetical protein
MLHDPPLIVDAIVAFGLVLLVRAIINAASLPQRPYDYAQPPGPPPPKIPPRGGPF